MDLDGSPNGYILPSLDDDVHCHCTSMSTGYSNDDISPLDGVCIIIIGRLVVDLTGLDDGGGWMVLTKSTRTIALSVKEELVGYVKKKR
jgi:hypothetical protein